MARDTLYVLADEVNSFMKEKGVGFHEAFSVVFNGGNYGKVLDFWEAKRKVGSILRRRRTKKEYAGSIRVPKPRNPAKADVVSGASKEPEQLQLVDISPPYPD